MEELDSSIQEAFRSVTMEELKNSIPCKELPMDVVVLILSRIPEAKTLSKLKCVSKTWLSLISSPDFVNTHLITNSKTSRRLMLSFAKGEYMDHYSLSHLLSTTSIDPRSRTDVSTDAIFDKRAKIIGSHNGLICLLVNKKELILWNPSIRKRKSLPDYDVPSSHSKRKFGFGFDNASNDYKVVGFFAKPNDEFAIIAKAFSFKTGEWKRIKSNRGAKFYSQNEPKIPSGNGKFYWVNCYTPRRVVAWSVWVLELETQVYRTFEIPVTEIRMNCTLALSEQNLVHVLGTADGYTDVWTMKEDNGKVFWTKVCTIDYAKIGLRPNAMFVYNCHLFHVLNNGEVMMRHLNTFIVYNPKDGSMRYCNIESPVARIKACTYAESLVWL